MINHPNRKKILFTLQDVRDARPCESGWKKLRTAIPGPLSTRLSLGDVAFANDAADALWCVRVLDWSDITIRRRVVAGAVLPAAFRVVGNATDKRVADCLDGVKRWCEGDDTVDLRIAAWSAASAEIEAQRKDIITAFSPFVLLAA